MLSAKIAKLERELALGNEQLRQAEGAVASLKLANEEFEACTSHLVA